MKADMPLIGDISADFAIDLVIILMIVKLKTCDDHIEYQKEKENIIHHITHTNHTIIHIHHIHQIQRQKTNMMIIIQNQIIITTITKKEK